MARHALTAVATLPALLAAALASCTLDTTGGLESGAELDSSVDQSSPWDAQPEDSSAPDAFQAAEDTGVPEANDEPRWDASPDALDVQVAEAESEAGCTPENDTELCEKHGKNCATVVVEDRCGAQRQVECGACLGWETCGGGGVPNVCGSWWACDWSRRMPVSVHTTGELPQGYSVKVTFDHASLVQSGLSLATGQDVRVLHRSGSEWTEVDRVLDPVSTWNQAQTTIWFATQEIVSASGTDSGYFVYAGNPAAGPAPADESKVFHFADLFDRADSTTVGNGWTVMEDGGTKLNVTGGALWFETTADVNNRPVAQHDFAPITGRLACRLGFNWARTGTEGSYRVHMQLGLSSMMDNPPAQQDVWSVAGVGPSLLWAGPNVGMTTEEGLGYAIGTTAKQVITATGKVDIDLRAALGSHDYSMNAGSVQSVGLAFSTAVDSLDRLRLFTWQVNQANFGPRGFDYVIVRRLVEPEPSIESSPAENTTCQ